MSFHSEVLVVEEAFLCPLVNQGVRFVRAAVAPSRPGIGLSMLGQDLGRK
jgi:hypothetical protein